MSEKSIEILSPAGCMETLVCAVNNGADAVYIGGQAFSARKNAVNFTNEEILSAVRYAHIHGSKVYVTVNTLVGDGDLRELYEYINFLYQSGADALIIQDIGVAEMVKRYFLDFEIHASTQMTIHNLEGAIMAKELGFSRVVLSRELTFEEIKYISENTDIELEVFVHGALCMSYSGQCLMSSFIGGRSGNKGACAQPCRLPYTLLDKNKKALSDKDKYLLSLKDLCLIDEMETLRNCNVRSLKIEGRMKSSEYVSVVTSMYNKYRNGGTVSHKDKEYLENIFSRSGFTKSYLYGKTGRNMLNYDNNNDKVYDNIKVDVREFAKQLAERKPDKIPLDCNVKIKHGLPMSVEVSSKGRTAMLTGSISADKAIKVPLTVERVREQMSKLGDTSFALANFSCEIDDEINLPIKEINEVRRKAISLIEDELIKIKIRKPAGEFSFSVCDNNKTYNPVWCAEVLSVRQADAVSELGFDKLLVPYNLYAENKKHIDGLGIDVAVVMPPICRNNIKIDYDILPQELYLSNISQLPLSKNHTVNADFRMNVYNSYAMKFMKDYGVKRVCLSPELALREINSIIPYLPSEIIVYGKIPLMTVQNCILKSSANKCICGDEHYFIRDRKGVCFPVFRDKLSCTNTIHNALPIYMADRTGEISREKAEAYRFVFTTETEDEIKKIFGGFLNKEKADFDFTRGHYYRGV